MAGKKTGGGTRAAKPTRDGATKTKNAAAQLTKSAEKAATAKSKASAAAVRRDIALILKRKTTIERAFYDIGAALVRLQVVKAHEVLGSHTTFFEFVEAELGLKRTTASELIAIASGIPRKEALALGQTKAAAFLELAKATPAKDTGAALARRTTRTPSGKAIGAGASAKEIEAAAREYRDAAAKKKPTRGRGRTSTPAERKVAAQLQAALRKAGAKRAEVKAVATAPGRESDLRIEKIAVGEVSALAKARVHARP